MTPAACTSGHPRPARRRSGRARGMRVTNRRGQRVGRVVRRRRGVEAEEELHHLLQLRLLGAAVAGHGQLHFGGRVLDHPQAGPTAASMATPRAWPSMSALRTFFA